MVISRIKLPGPQDASCSSYYTQQTAWLRAFILCTHQKVTVLILSPVLRLFLFDLDCVHVDCYSKILWIAQLKEQTYVSHHLEAEVQD